VIFIVENNLYAASTPFNLTFRVNNIADRACAYGIPGVVVDGNDVLAVHKAAKEAVTRARQGHGPTLLECKTYRQCGHSWSDARGYRSKEEEQEWIEKDPIPRFKELMICDFGSTAVDIERIETRVEEDLEMAIAFAESSPEPDAADTYTDVFKE